MKKINLFYIFFPICCILIFFRLEILFGSDVEAPFTDDFYYYLTTVRNLVDIGLISFDGISLTNGFQPLWFLYITIIFYLFENYIIFNLIIIISIFLFSFLTYLNFRKFLLSEGYQFFESHMISSLISYLTLFFSKNGMEISIAIYLFSLSLVYFKKNVFFFCLLSFLTFLSRLEFLIFYFVLLSNEILTKRKILELKYIINLLFLPLLISIYIIINIYYFGLPFPESGVAKSLTNKILVNKETFSFLFTEGFGMRFISVLFCINIFGIFLIRSKNTNNFTKISIITTILFFLSNSIRSSWPLWTWHFFFLAISTPLIINDILKIINFKKYNIILYLTGIFFVASYSFLLFLNFNVNNDHMLNIAKKVKENYKSSENTIFAMGDMAGKVSFLLNKNLIQLEGLVGGKRIINKIRNEENLCKVLQELKVDKYFTTKVKKIDNKSFYAEEPSLDSKNIKKMRGKFFSKPEKIFESADINLYVFNLKNKNICIKH